MDTLGSEDVSRPNQGDVETGELGTPGGRNVPGASGETGNGRFRWFFDFLLTSAGFWGFGG